MKSKWGGLESTIHYKARTSGQSFSFQSQLFHMESANSNSCSQNQGLKFGGRIKSKDEKIKHTQIQKDNLQGFKKDPVKALDFVFKLEI